ncbi:MAG TPA: winged helix-turn-helix domain-containing protein, partial [Opitutaceae bacterium]
MIHRVSELEFDEDRREVRVRGKALDLQPRVLDFIAYLAKNRDRVVPKDELLDALWPGVIVSETSLHRAASVARTALSEAGLPGAIRNRQRQGYFLNEENCGGSSAVAAGAATVLAQAHDAYGRGEWEAAIKALQKVDSVDGLTADDLQVWAHSAQCAGRPQEAHGPLERAVAAYATRGDKRHAAWAAILLAHLKVEWREPALAKGWYHRAERLLKDEPPCREKGYLDMLGGRMALMANELEESLELANRARAAGEEFGDADLEGLALVHVGEANLYLGHISEGLAAIDEAGVSVVADGLSSWAGGLIYCGVIYSCITRADWHRASQWTEQFTRWCEGRGSAGYPGLCRMHRAEVLTVQGELGTAEVEIRGTQEALARQAPWAEGDTWRVLGDICLAKGEFDAARKAYERASELGWECQFGIALLHLAKDDPSEAARLFGRILAENMWSGRTRRGQTLAYYVIAAARSGMLDEARDALAKLTEDAGLTSTSALQALLAHARGELAAAEGDWSAATASLRRSVREWQAIDAPLAAAEVRCRL